MRGEVLPTCGPTASTRLRDFTKRGIVVDFNGTSVTVNKEEWILEGITIGVAHNQYDANLKERYEVWFYRKAARARGFASYLQFGDDGLPTCGDSLQLVGDFKSG